MLSPLLGHKTPTRLAIASLNREKSDKITDRARVFARELYDAGLLLERAFEVVKMPNSSKELIKNNH